MKKRFAPFNRFLVRLLDDADDLSTFLTRPRHPHFTDYSISVKKVQIVRASDEWKYLGVLSVA